ncbi:MAG: sigma 54-interacting transcriptional regulator [Thermodesulfovibrionia bacterium]
MDKPTNLYQAILENIAEGIVIIDLEKKVILLNKMARELLGLGRDVVVEGRLCSEIVRTELCLNNCPFDSMDNRCDITSHFININLLKDSSDSIPLCLNVAPLTDSDGNLIGIIENFRPMSEAIKVIESLRQSNIILSQEKDKVDSIIESLADGVFTVDRELRITSFNRGMEGITGFREDEVLGKRCDAILRSDNCSGDCPLSLTIQRGYGMANMSERIAKRDGGTIPVYITTAFLKDNSGGFELIATVRDASEIERLRKEINDRYKFSNIIGRSGKMQEIFEMIEILADTDCSILIEGESGTGKELVSRAIHHESRRRDKPFIKVNCSAIVEGLFESELFGHVKGAFSGAIRDKVGKFELADGGTIFLDEIADMPLSLQPKLLRVLQDMEFERVGDNKTIKVDVRVIAATNKDLKDEIEKGRFREDLYYRLCVVPLIIPPLRERKEDIPILIEHFLEKCHLKMPNKPRVTDITPDALSLLLDYDWHGNVRELENTIEHAFIRARAGVIDIKCLPPSILIASSNKPQIRASIETPESLDEIERQKIQELLRRFNGNKTKVASNLGISRTTLWRRLKAM